MAQGNRANWEFYLNMNWLEFDNYFNFWQSKQKEKKGTYRGAKTAHDIIIKQLNEIING